MNRAGIETWLMHVLRRHDTSRLQFELLLNSEAGSDDYEAELHDLGIVIHRCPPTSKFLAFVTCLWRTFRRGHYDIVHSHVHHFSGLILLVARLAGIRGRVAHSHLDTRVLDGKAGWPRKTYQRVMDVLIARVATDGVAVSEDAAAALFGTAWSQRSQVIPLGLETSAYRQQGQVDRTGLRETLGLSSDALVIGHVGGFRTQKNHPFLLQVFAHVIARQPDARLLLVGEGQELAVAKAQAGQLNIMEAVVFAGSRGDVPELLQAMNVFIWPSHFEGLGLALIEAQMAGLPCVVASHLPAEAHLPESDLTLLPLAAGPETWAEALLAAAEHPRRFPAAHPFDLTQSMNRFTEIYERHRR